MYVRFSYMDFIMIAGTSSTITTFLGWDYYVIHVHGPFHSKYAACGQRSGVVYHLIYGVMTCNHAPYIRSLKHTNKPTTLIICRNVHYTVYMGSYMSLLCWKNICYTTIINKTIWPRFFTKWEKQQIVILYKGKFLECFCDKDMKHRPYKLCADKNYIMVVTLKT